MYDSNIRLHILLFLLYLSIIAIVEAISKNQGKKLSLVSKNSIHKVKITQQSEKGDGIAYFGDDSFRLIVPNTLPGDELNAKVLRISLDQGYCKADLNSFTDYSPQRTAAPCAIAARCGGCQLQHQKYDAQLIFKHQIVVNSFNVNPEIAQLAPIIEPVLPSPLALGYRNKLQFAIQRRPDRASQQNKLVDKKTWAKVSDVASGLADSTHPYAPRRNKKENKGHDISRDNNKAIFDELDGRIELGLYATHSHNVVDTHNCEIMSPLINDVLICVRNHFNSYSGSEKDLSSNSSRDNTGVNDENKDTLGSNNISSDPLRYLSVYDERTQTGALRHLVVRVGDQTKEIMVCLVSARPYKYHQQQELMEFVQAVQTVPGVTSVLLNYNKEPGDEILGEETVVNFLIFQFLFISKLV